MAVIALTSSAMQGKEKLAFGLGGNFSRSLLFGVTLVLALALDLLPTYLRLLHELFLERISEQIQGSRVL